MRCNKIGFPQVVFWVSLILGAVVRLAYLNEVPSGYAFDEVGIAYDAWSISTWHRDQFAHFMPLSFESFGDYKPPVMIYLTGLFYLLIGPQLIVVRLISAAAGVLSIAVSFYLAKAIFPKSKLAPAFVALTVALSPWSLHLSRIGFEQNLAFLFGLSGITLLFMGRNRSWYWIPAGICLALSMSTFHTAKIFVPMVLLSFFWTYRSLMYRYRRQALIGLLVFLMAITPIAYDSLLGQGNARAETLVSSLTELGDNVMNYISPGFWIMGWDGISIRHTVPGYGVLLWPFYLILIGTILVLVRNKRLKDIYWPLALIVMGLMPGILTRGSPHVIRSQFALIGSALIVGYGLELIRQYKKIFSIICAAIFLVFLGYMREYFIYYPEKSAAAFQYGYREVLEIAKREQTTPIVMTDSYDQPYIYALFYNKIPAQKFLWGELNNYQFRPIHWPENQPGIYIGTPQEIPANDPAVIDIVTVPQSSTILWVVAKI